MYQLPLKGKVRLTTPFGKKGNWACGFHTGIDLVGDSSKNVYPLAGGTVESIDGHGSSYGRHVCIRHLDGNVSLYAHLAAVYVDKGQKVGPSTVLGREGATGNASGSHLHLEIHRGSYQYPLKNSSPAKCSWLLDPAAALGIENKAGQVKEAMNSNEPSAWAKEAWAWAKEKGIVDGTRPKDNVTREELAAVIWSAIELVNKSK